MPSSNQADAIILATNKGVMALGGFSGSDPILTTSQLASLVANGTVPANQWQSSSNSTTGSISSTQLYSCAVTK